ncbi:MAG TPA: energy transducer TonB [Vicinamibacterales bacterium]|jgi:protein TonB|nr:energy transducer TonB [Vicinamibacterales bacterium]
MHAERFQARLAVTLGALGLLLISGAAFAGQDKPATPPPLRVGGTIKSPTKIKDVKPVYPEDARRAKLQGVVITEATIGVDGKVTAVKVLRPLAASLDDAAIVAVKQQVYKPTMVNGVAVSVITTVPVFFSLN